MKEYQVEITVSVTALAESEYDLFDLLLNALTIPPPQIQSAQLIDMRKPRILSFPGGRNEVEQMPSSDDL